MAAPPPSYEERHDGNASGSSLAEAGAMSGLTPGVAPPTSPPAGAQRALAPLSITESNASIKGCYLVAIGENKAGPDVHLQNSNGSTQATVYIDGQVPRPVGIVAKSTNGSIKLVIPDKVLDQEYDIDVQTSNGSMAVTLPVAFNGLLTVTTVHGSIKLGDSLRNRSMIVPGQGQQGTTTYRIAPVHIDPASGDDKRDGQAGSDRCTLRTSNGSIRVRLYDEFVARSTTSATGGGGSNCAIM